MIDGVVMQRDLDTGAWTTELYEEGAIVATGSAKGRFVSYVEALYTYAHPKMDTTHDVS